MRPARRRSRLGCALAGCGCAALLCGGGPLAALVGVPAVIRGQAAVRERMDPHDAAPGGVFVDVGDVELHVTVDGPEDGPPVVLVHGSGAWGGTWRSVAPALASAGHRVYAVDLPPFGYSTRPAGGDYTTEAQAARIVSFLEARDLRDVALVGHSFGGLATVETALRSDRVARLVLVDVALGLTAPAEPSATVQALLWAQPVRELLVSATFTNPWFTPTGLRAFVADPADATPDVVAMYRAPLAVRGSTDAIARWLPELLAPTTHPAAADPASYGRIAVPTLVVWGARDTATPLAQAEDLRARTPGARLEVLDGVGHIPQIEDPAALNAVLVPFVATGDDATR